MFSPFSCASFNHQEEDDDEAMTKNQAFSPTRKSSRSKSSGFYRRHSKNPYSSVGLDKFSALVADLEEKRQQIYAQNDPKDISFVRFVYKDSTDTSVPVPIVVKRSDKKEDKTSKVVSDHEEKIASPKDMKQQPKLETEEQSNKQRTLSNWAWPCFYLPAVVILILVLLALFGRSFAILCTSIIWYAVPTLKEFASHARRGSSKKKDYVRRLSDDKIETISSPKYHNSSVTSPSRQHIH